MTAMQIRQTWPDDASAVAGVYVRSWQAAFAGLVPQHYLDAMDPNREESEWKTRIAETRWPSSGVLVAETEAGIVGFASFGPSQDIPVTAEIGTLYAMPEVWGRGIGKQLMLATLAALGQADYPQATLMGPGRQLTCPALLRSRRLGRRRRSRGGLHRRRLSQQVALPPPSWLARSPFRPSTEPGSGAERGVDVEEVRRDDALGLRAEELTPGRTGATRRRVDARCVQDLPHRRGCDPVSESGQLALGSPVAPARILIGESQDEVLGRHGGSGRPVRLRAL